MDSVSNVNVALLVIDLCDAVSARLRDLSHHVPILPFELFRWMEFLMR
jgi:hypothetical protein